MTGRASTAPGRRVKRALGQAWKRLSQGESGSLPVVLGLVLLWAVFQWLNGNFFSPRNLSNLSVDIVGTGLIAVGIVFVLLIGEIDLSVGSVSGLAAAVFAVLNVNEGLPEWLALVIAVLAGALIGALHGFFFARFGVPAFVITLAGLLAWNGLTLYLLGQSGTINLDDQGLVAKLTSYYFHDIAAAYGLAALGAAVFFLTACRDRWRRKAAAMPYRPLREIAVRTGLIAAVAFAAAYVLNQFQGLPLALLIFVVLVAALDVLLRRTPYGRRVYALGGGVEAARRAGVRVAWVRVSVLTVSGTMAALGGLFLASRITSVGQPSTSGILVLNAIAAAVIGGTSLFGGHGRTWCAVLGMLVIQSISSGMALLSIQSALQFMITGGVLLAAVVLDSVSRRSQKSRGRA
ncbi:sugar ABC transporter permease [Streptomyces cuspidosporus]|uniref:Xylose transport system permease protein XylH n=1 Tax=Streptomyces cuspidosporus TaxID=66882 RepID=A0ABN3H9N2_9ACTN